MKKVSLLSLSLAACLSSFAADEWPIFGADYIILDGVVQPGAVYTPFTYKDLNGFERESPHLIEYPNEGYCTMDHPGIYQGIRFDLDSTIFNLHLKGKNLVLEYELPRSFMLLEPSDSANINSTTEKLEKPTFNIMCSKDTGVSFAWEKKFIVFQTIDGKFNPEACEGFVKFDDYCFPLSNERVNSVYITYARELNPGGVLNTGEAYESKVEPCKIKNLYFVAKEEYQPFFSQDFPNINIWNSDIKMGIYSTTDLTRVSNKDMFADAHYPTLHGPDDTSVDLYLTHRWENSWDGTPGSDGSGFFDTEMFYSLAVDNSTLGIMPNDEAFFAFDDIAIPSPQSGYPNDIFVSFLAKAYISNPLKFEETDQIPVYLKFDNDDKEYLACPDSVIRGQWVRYNGRVHVPDGAKTVSVYMKQAPQSCYTIDKLILGNNWKNSVAKVDGESKTLTVYPNPVGEAISFSGVEDVKSVEIVSLNGAVISCPVVNDLVNVSNLAAGEYVVIVNKTITGKFIKK